MLWNLPSLTITPKWKIRKIVTNERNPKNGQFSCHRAGNLSSNYTYLFLPTKKDKFSRLISGSLAVCEAFFIPRYFLLSLLTILFVISIFYSFSHLASKCWVVFCQKSCICKFVQRKQKCLFYSLCSKPWLL